MVITFCGPACSGKDTVVSKLMTDNKLTGFKRLIQHTTRPMRPGEKEGVEYFFHESKDEAKDPFSLKEFTVSNGDKWYYWFEYDEVINAVESRELFITISDVDGTINFFNHGARAIIIDVPIEERIKRYYERELKKSEPNFKEAMRRIIADIDDFQIFNNPDAFFTSHWGKSAQYRIRQINNNRPIEDTIEEINKVIWHWVYAANRLESPKKTNEEKDDSESTTKKHDQGCEKCFYVDACPCNWSRNSGACIIFRTGLELI